MNRHDPRLHAAARRHANALRNAAFAEAFAAGRAWLRRAAAALGRRAHATTAAPREAACRS